MSAGLYGRGRNAGFPAPPAQIPACGITAPGSCLGSDAEALVRVRMHNSHGGYPFRNPPLVSKPRQVSPFLTAPPQCPYPVSDDLFTEPVKSMDVARDSIVVSGRTGIQKIL